MSDVAAELGLSTGQLSTWRVEQLAAGSAEALAQRKAEEAEMQRLKRENKHLKKRTRS
jgi:transposase